MIVDVLHCNEAISHNVDDAVETLIAAGCNKEAADLNGRTPLIGSSINTSTHDIGVLNLLLSVGCDINARDHTQNTALHHAVLRDDGGVFATCLIAVDGCDKDAVALQGRTPLHLVAIHKHNHQCIAQELITGGCNKEAKDRDGCTPLRLAASAGKLDLVTYMVSHNCNKEAADIHARTSILMSCNCWRAMRLMGSGCSAGETLPPWSTQTF